MEFDFDNLPLEDQEQIQSILMEAEEWGLEIEVNESAEKYMMEGHSPIDAFHFAYEDWIK